MNGYKTVRTATGRKIRVHMDEDEIRERRLYHIAITLLPFVATVLLFWTWLEVGG